VPAIILSGTFLISNNLKSGKMNKLKLARPKKAEEKAEEAQSNSGQELGYFAAAQYSLIEIYGPDSERFINAQTTSDVKALKPYQWQPSALLDRKAHVVAYFNLYRKNSSYRIIAEESQVATILEHLDKYIFSDKVELLNLSSGKMLALIGSDARTIINDNLSQKNSALFERDLIDGDLCGINVHIFRAPLSSREAFLIYCSGEQFESLNEKLLPILNKKGARKLTEDDLLVERVEAGLPQFAKDFTSENLIIELGLEDKAISYTKGCFQGQEVLARVKGHGSPNKQLAGLILELKSNSDKADSEKITTNKIPIGTPLMVAGQEVAKILSNAYSERMQQHIALAMVKRDYRTPGRVLEVSIETPAENKNTNTFSGQAKIKLLPFIEPEDLKQKAKSLYEEALKLYATLDNKQQAGESQDQSQVQGESTNTDEAISKLRTALLLDSSLEDAYEALGVILSKENQLDEAVELMEALARINPDSIMAYANLSVFYLEQGGGKEKAEEAKAQSMSIRMRLAAKEAMQEHQQKEDTAKIEAEAIERKAMFEQVIEIDSDDLFANNGLGNCYNILQQYQLAEPYLLKAIEIKPNHTVAYQELGRTYEGLGQIEKAIETFKRGIDVAAQKGDMTPLKAMQARLDCLLAKPESKQDSKQDSSNAPI
jgi:folate-binding protein YgfZ